MPPAVEVATNPGGNDHAAKGSSYFSVDEWVSLASQCKYLPETDMKALCDIVSSYLLEEPNIVPVATPVTICGDIHGQYYDLEELFRTGGAVPDTSYVFMGDFVDRGYYSLETLTRLLTLKARYPDRITLIRGNHESRQITQVYGFYDECLQKYGNANVWRHCCRVFDLLAIAALIDDKALCVHGGLSPEVKTLDKIATIQRDVEIPHKGAFCDLMWSDPEDVESWAISPRGAGWLFGRSVTDRFLHTNDLSLICRAHQLVQEGYKYLWDEKIVTVWSAPNYCYRCGNVAAVLEFKSAQERVAKIFKAVDDDKRVIPERNTSPQTNACTDIEFLFEMKSLLLFVLVVIAAVGAFRQQSAAVTGRLFCGTAPAANVQVKLVDNDGGPDPDDEMDSGYTDADGKFSLSGDTRELTTIDPFLKVYHDCNDGAVPCQRKWKIQVPDKYVTAGKTPKKAFNLGDVNLEVELSDEDHDCIHKRF
uniref:Serine/threonine-protein phosphatase n=1 Tax=Plectus sambesii TaxID=2011161 RepID=A0A914WED9_9BILA